MRSNPMSNFKVNFKNEIPFWNKKGLGYRKYSLSPITRVKSFAKFRNKGLRIISYNGEDLSVSQPHFTLFSVSKCNPQNIFFSQSRRLTYKELQVTCEMGQKSTHLIEEDFSTQEAFQSKALLFVNIPIHPTPSAKWQIAGVNSFRAINVILSY